MVKILLFIAIFTFVVPLGATICKGHPKLKLILFGAMIFFSCTDYKIHLNPIPEWRGTARGYALTGVDIFSSMLLLALFLEQKFKLYFAPPGWWLYGLYFMAIVISGINAIHIHPWGFEVTKMCWMYIFFLASFNFLDQNRDLWPLIYIICGVLLWAFFIALKQKYLEGRFQVPSTFPHQNSLALYATMFGTIALGVVLNEKCNLFHILTLSATVVISLLLVIFTYSRGGLFCCLLGMAMVGILSLIIHGVTGRKLFFSVVGIITAAIFLGIAAPQIINRFENAPKASKMTRINLAKAAVRIADTYPTGVGANNFSEFSGPYRDFTREHYAEVRLTEETNYFGGIVETIYLLVAAECGWYALVILLLWFSYYYVLAWINTIKLRKLPCGGLSLGIAGGLSSNFLQSTMEWVLKQYCNFYQLMLIFALIGLIATYRKRLRRNP